MDDGMTVKRGDLSGEKPSVLVMMATYNGGDLVTGQIESILSQEGVTVDLLISDDGSTDGTAELGQSYAERYPNVTFRKNPHEHGATWNFLGMVYDADPSAHRYFAFADQDDLWLAHKLARAVECLAAAPAGALYYSDVTNVDLQTGATLPSASPRFADVAQNLGTLLILNWAPGCTMVFDCELMEQLHRHKPNDVPRYHDDWVHQVALSTLHTVPDLETSLIRHQITSKNLTGHTDFDRASWARLKQIARNLRQPKEHHVSRAARELLAGYGAAMHPEARAVAEAAAELDRSFGARMRALGDERFVLPMPKENLLLKARMLLNYL